ncbi:MAG: hypothetical protein L0I80_12375 [Brevibacterium sp.]|nr:hypothetical protein [Brevibacterium sp.]
MRKRTDKFFATVVCGVVFTVIALIAFSTFNAGIDPRLNSRGDVNPSYAAMVGFGFLGFFHAVAIIFFSDDDAAAADGRRPARRIPDSFTGFIRQDGHTVFSVGPIFAAFCTASVFIWHAIATDPGAPGTVWGDYTTSLLPALVLFLSCWTTINIGFTLASCAEAFHRDRSGLFATFLVAMFVLALGLTAGFLSLPAQPTGGALIVSVIAFPLSLLAMARARSWAITRVAGWDAIHPRSVPQTEPRAVPGPMLQHELQSLFRPLFRPWLRPEPRLARCDSLRPGTSYPGGPPLDMLRRGEQLLMHFKSERTPEPQLLIATNQRCVRASILGADTTFILEQASPGQLTGARSERVGRDLTTTVHFHGSRVMRVVGGDPEQSRAFAEAVDRLARTGRLPR